MHGVLVCTLRLTRVGEDLDPTVDTRGVVDHVKPEQMTVGIMVLSHALCSNSVN